MPTLKSLSSLRWIAALVLCSAFMAGTAADSTRSLAGISLWSGRYDYANNSQPAVPFTLAIKTAQDGSFIGETTEPPTFGNGSSAALTAAIKGVISDTVVQFTKTYDGSGGQTHAVEYAGTLSADGHSMKGTWRIGDLHGTFSASLVSVYSKP